MKTQDFDARLSNADIAEVAIPAIDMLREFVTYGLCRQNNTAERKMLAERFAQLAGEALKRFPSLKLNHVGAKTILATDEPKGAEPCTN